MNFCWDSCVFGNIQSLCYSLYRHRSHCRIARNLELYTSQAQDNRKRIPSIHALEKPLVWHQQNQYSSNKADALSKYNHRLSRPHAPHNHIPHRQSNPSKNQLSNKSFKIFMVRTVITILSAFSRVFFKILPWTWRIKHMTKIAFTDIVNKNDL